MNKKLLMMWMAFVLLIGTLIFVACAGPAPAPAPSPAPTTKPTTAPTPAPSPSQVYELKYATYMPANHWAVTDAMLPFFKELETKSNGRIKITPFYSESLGKAADQYDMVAKGIADLSLVNPSYTPGRFPVIEILNLPSAFKTAAQGNLIAMKMRPELEREFPDVKLLAPGDVLPYSISLKKRVTTLEDLKGLKIRTAGGVTADTVSLLGAVPVNLAAGEMYTALERGTIDGLLIAIPGWSAYKIDEVAKYALDAGGLGSLAVIWPMNKKKFESLPADLQNIILDAAPELPAKYGKAFDDQDVIARKNFQAKGIEIITLSSSEMARWKKQVMPVWDKWVADVKKLGLPAEQVMSAFNKAIEEVVK